MIQGSDSVYIVLGNGAAPVLISNDRGNSWRTVLTPLQSGEASAGIFSIDFKSDGLEGIVVGGDYRGDNFTTVANAALTRDGGDTRELIPDGNNPGVCKMDQISFNKLANAVYVI